jgi:hypothetical protein
VEASCWLRFVKFIILIDLRLAKLRMLFPYHLLIILKLFLIIEALHSGGARLGTQIMVFFDSEL